MTAIVINALTLVLLVYSLLQHKQKTIKALKLAVMKAISLFPIIFGITILIGLMLGFFPPELIQTYLGGEMNLFQVGAAALVGAITMIPNMISVPLAGSLIDSGASYTTIAAFLTTLTMVGFVTFPLELKEMGRKITLWRNLLALFFAVFISIIIGLLM